MKQQKLKLRLSLPQILAVAGVWGEEVYPKLSCFWQQYGEKCRTCRRPDLYAKAYGCFIAQMFSPMPAEEVVFTKGVLSIFVAQAANLLEQICPDAKKAPGVRRLDRAVQALAYFTQESILPAGLILDLSASERKNARKILKTLFAVDADGYPDYDHCVVALSYSDRGQLQEFSISPILPEFS